MLWSLVDRTCHGMAQVSFRDVVMMGGRSVNHLPYSSCGLLPYYDV